MLWPGASFGCQLHDLQCLIAVGLLCDEHCCKPTWLSSASLVLGLHSVSCTACR